MCVKGVSSKNDEVEFATKPSKTNLFNILILVMVYLFIFAIGFLIIWVSNNLIISIVFLLITIISLIAFILYFLSKPKQLLIGKAGIVFVTGLGKKLYSFSEVEKIAPVIKIDYKSYDFPEYYGINLWVKDKKEILIITNSKDANKFYYNYLKLAPGVLLQERTKVPLELKQFKEDVIQSSKNKDYIIVATIFFTIIIAVIAIPDVNLRGENMTLPIKIGIGFLLGAIVAGFVLVIYGMIFSSNFKAGREAFVWRIEIYNKVVKKKKDDLITLDQKALDDIEKITSISLKYTGIFMMVMGLIIPILALFSILKFGYSGGLFMIIFMSPLAIPGGFILYRRSIRSEIA